MAPVNQRLLPSVVDELAATDPERVLYSVPKSKDLKDGFRDITAKTFARVVDRCAWYLKENLGQGQGFPTLTYLGPQDLVYPILVLATIKTGHKLLLNSPRNSLEAHLSIFENTQCDTFLLPPNFPLPMVKQILAAREMKVIEIPGLQYWIENGSEERYPYNKTFEDARLDPMIVFHTSGTTGLPKPIVQTHATLSPQDALTALPALGYKPVFPVYYTGKRIYLAFPLFHCAGLMILLTGIYAGYTVVLGPSPLSPDVIDAVHTHGNVQYSCMSSASVADLANNAEYLENLTRIKHVYYGGGPLTPAVGNLVSTKTQLRNCIGSTECGPLPVHLCDPEDWAYLSYSPVLGSEFREVSEGLYEHVIVRSAELEVYQGVFGTFPELTEWSMKDLYSKHPTKDNTWLYRGRTDDIIVFSSGEKLNPIDMEDIISSDPAVSAALITGIGRFQSCLLVEAVQPPSNNAGRDELLDAIWPSVQAANKTSPSHGRIHRSMIVFTSPEKPMLRAGKGTVQRKLTIDLYTEELDLLYKASEDVTGNTINNVNTYENGTNGSPKGHGNIGDMIKHIVVQSSDIDANLIPQDANLFELGLDSLQVITITRAINELLARRAGKRPIEARTVYANPSIASLVAAVSAVIEGQNVASGAENDEKKMRALFETHANNMPITARRPEPRPAENTVVLLTGSTGSLGSYILDSLISNSSITHIYCLNRGPNSGDRQAKSQVSRGLQVVPLGRVEFLDADLSKPYFGLEMPEFKILLREVTVVIHNAWQVDFNLGIDSYASQIGGVRQLVDFSAHSKFGAHIFFISSVGAVAGLDSTDSVEETVFQDWHTPELSGYSQSKFVAERLLDVATREAEVPTTVCRVGQIAGPTTVAGAWPKQEWLPSLIASSKFLGKLPLSIGRQDLVDWIPVDDLGRSIVELATSSSVLVHDKPSAVVYHAANPQHTSWEKLVPTINNYLGREKNIEMVSFEAWVESLRESASKANAKSTLQNPAVKLVDFFEGLAVRNRKPVVLDTKKAMAASPSLAVVREIRETLVENWLRQWGF